MTVKQISEFSLKTERTVQRWAKKASDKMSSIDDKMSSSSPMNPADYTIDEVEMILNESSLGQNAVLIIMENARNSKPAPSIDMTGPLIAFMSQMQSQQEKFMAAVLEKLDNRSGDIVSPKQIAAPQQDFRSMLNQLVGKYAKEKTDGDRREAWGVLYEELYYRCHISVRTRANNRKMAKLDVIEEAGLLESAYLIMVEKLGE